MKKCTFKIAALVLAVALLGLAGCNDPVASVTDNGGINVPEYFSPEQLNLLVSNAKTALSFGIYPSDDGFTSPDKADDLVASDTWVPTRLYDRLVNAIAEAELTLASVGYVSVAYYDLADALDWFETYQWRGGQPNPYYRENPGLGLRNLPYSVPSMTEGWDYSNPSDARIATANTTDGGGTFEFAYVANPFNDGNGDLVMLTSTFDPVGKSLGWRGFGMAIPLDTEVVARAGTVVEFTLYYPKSAAGKYMRFEIWANTGSAKSQNYVRTADLSDINNTNPEWVINYNGESWFKKVITSSTFATSGTMTRLNIDLHTDTDAALNGNTLYIGNIRVLQPDPEGVPLPQHRDYLSFSQVAPLREKFTPEKGLFYMGYMLAGSGPSFTTANAYNRHYDLYVHGNAFKPFQSHTGSPAWLRAIYPSLVTGTTNEYFFQGGSYVNNTTYYLNNRNAGRPAHGHVLSWYDSSPTWMNSIIPQNVNSPVWNEQGLYYGSGNGAGNVQTFVSVNKNDARRMLFNHTMNVMRHFMSTDEKYGSSAERGVIPFHSVDVLNEEIHESRHSTMIPADPTVWETALRHTSWLMAMTDDDLGDIQQHYIYLLFKFAHIAVPNAQMAAAYKANYDSLPDYMKLDGHDTDGSIDAYISAKPPVLVYNDYAISNYTKARVAYNMIKAINSAWLEDPLYDGRSLIECMGIQGHDTVSPTAASDNQVAFAMYASLIDQGLLDSICVSELDLKYPSTAPGGGALQAAGTVLNQKQADAIGYQFALLFQVYEKYAKYVDHIVNWGTAGTGFQSSYLLFDHNRNGLTSPAQPGYFAAMDPIKYMRGHSYLAEEYFIGEFEKVQKYYIPDLSQYGL